MRQYVCVLDEVRDDEFVCQSLEHFANLFDASMHAMRGRA